MQNEQSDRRSDNIGKKVVVNFPDNTGPSYHDGVIVKHIRGNKYDIEFEDGVASVYLKPDTRGIDWFIKRGDWSKFREKRVRYYGGSGV